MGEKGKFEGDLQGLGSTGERRLKRSRLVRDQSGPFCKRLVLREDFC